MSIVIYSYHNPYSLKDNQELWDEIVNCPYFCVSQTLVNGLKTLYGKDFQINRVTTVKNLTDAVYRYWTGTACAVKQHADIDNIISMASERCGLNADEVENIRKSFLFNRNEVFNSIRTMFELRMNPNNIVEKYLTPEQKFIVFIFNEIINSARNKDFLLKDNFTEQEIEEAIMEALQIVKENASASFECLKSTMSLYLVQETKPGKSANWIVKNYEQIDGDVLRTAKDNKTQIMHFACLTDEDIDAVKTREFSWPLNADFFEVAQNPVDWKYQVFVKARKEYKNFKRYALIYGLEFNKGKYKLSYVKRDGDLEREPYYLLKILGVDKKRNIDRIISRKLEDVSKIQFKNSSLGTYSLYDYYRYKICKKRFLFETLTEGNTIYKDEFLLAKYLEIWVENEIKESMQGLPGSELLLVEKINEKYDELKKYFPFAMNVNRIDIVNNVKNRLESVKKYPFLSEKDRKFMMIRELFIYKQLKNPKKFNKDVLKDKFIDIPPNKIEEELSKDKLIEDNFRSSTDVWCQYCSNREICIAYYAQVD